MKKQTSPIEIQNPRSHYIFTFFCRWDCWRECRWLSRRRFWKGENKHQLTVFSGKRGRSWSRNSSGESMILTAVFSENLVNLGPTLNQPKPMKAGSNHLLNFRLKAWNAICHTSVCPEGVSAIKLPTSKWFQCWFTAGTLPTYFRFVSGCFHT